MANPLIYFCYGIPKAGSALAFNLTRAILEDAGITQDPLDAPEAIAPGVFNTVGIIRPDELAALTDAVDILDVNPIAIKTHSGLWGCVERALTAGWTQGQAICRDPRDIAMAMIAAAPSGDPWGRRNGAPITTPQEALPAVKAHVEKFERWAEHTGILTLTYDVLRYDTEAAAAQIADQLGLTVDVEQCARAGLAMPLSSADGNDGQWRRDMTKADIAEYTEVFGAFIAKYDLGTATPKGGGLLSKVRGRLTKGGR